jgi:gluconate 2-dehydrogenase subunit 3-like protein
MDDPSEKPGRRAVLQGLLGGVGGAILFPLAGEAHPIVAHLADRAKVDRAKAQAAAGKPEFLDAHQFATLSLLSERILPGSVASGSDRFIDQLLAVDSRENQARFLGALGAFEGEARSRFGRPWKVLDEAQQVEVLTAASTLEPGTPRARGRAAAPRPEPGQVNLRDHFDHLKGWIVGAHYSSEAGMRELGWTGRSFFTSFPDCPHPDKHA